MDTTRDRSDREIDEKRNGRDRVEASGPDASSDGHHAGEHPSRAGRDPRRMPADEEIRRSPGPPPRTPRPRDHIGGRS